MTDYVLVKLYLTVCSSNNDDIGQENKVGGMWMKLFGVEITRQCEETTGRWGTNRGFYPSRFNFGRLVA